MRIPTRNSVVPSMPREKLIASGAASLDESELLAIFLRTGVAGKPAISLAKELLDRFGGLSGLMSSTYEQLAGVKGMGVSKSCQLLAILEITRRYLAHQAEGLDYIQSPAQAREFLHVTMRSFSSEVFACLFLDARNRVISYRELFYGSLSGANVYPREVVKRVLEENAAAVIFAHNHPSGDPSPSNADVAVTARLQEALALIDVRVLDHVIVGEQVVSLAELGYL